MKTELWSEENFEEEVQDFKIIRLKSRAKKKVPKYANRYSNRVLRKPTPISEFETDFCVALWRGVVMQAIYDISAAAQDYEKKLLKANCYSWFSGEDFALVCQLAEMNPNKILDLVRLIRCGRVQVLDSKTFRIRRQ